MGGKQEVNPFHQKDFRGFSTMADNQSFDLTAKEHISGNHVFKHIDATLNVKGLPQSGTGQTALFTGENAPKKIGKHHGPFPHSGIKPLLQEESLFMKAQAMNKQCRFINAYPDIFFKKAQKRDRWSCTTMMTKSAGIPLYTVEEIKQGHALTAEITQKAWKKQLKIDIPEITPEKAANRLLRKAGEYDVVLYEYYLTDKAGHSRDMQKAMDYLTTYDRFLWHLMQNKQKEVTLVLSSDHGNIEDLSTKTHTLNPVPLYCYGPGASCFSDASSIMDITPAILKALA